MRAGIVHISEAVLRRWLDNIGWGDARVLSADYDPLRRILILGLEHEEMPIIREGEVPQVIHKTPG